MEKENSNISLIEGCISNDRHAQKNLYYSYYDAMMKVCIAFTKNGQDAQEVLNNGFLKIFKHIGAYDLAKASFYTWARKLMVNAALDFLKKKISFEELGQHYTEGVSLAINNEIENKFDEEQVLNILKVLPPATETVFRLFILEDYSHKEIAMNLSISEGTSKWHVSQARVMMKKYLLHTK